MPTREIDRIEWALRERVKELTCLYGIAQVAKSTDQPLDAALQAIADLLPPAWQYPEAASARVVLDGREYTCGSFTAVVHRQGAALVIGEATRGTIEVAYRTDVPSRPAFLIEEEKLLEMVAREVSLLVERHDAQQRKAHLEGQLRHADRLATIGQLAAGVAHEINEPLANILGFAQLARKAPGVTQSLAADLDKIVKSCLHAREVIQKLLTFARQMPPAMTLLSLNQVVNDGIYFLESRCAKAGIEVVRRLDANLPSIYADAPQMHQVLVNLVVNAVQAMPHGGRLTIETHAVGSSVQLIVRDTGVGMDPETLKNIFTPFFTTKDVDEGTGLGLAVVDGIVSSHGGTIVVESAAGQGASFTVNVPLNRDNPAAEAR